MIKKTQLLAIVMSIIIVISTVAGCKNDSNSDSEQNLQPEIYLPESTEKTVLTLATFNINEVLRDRVTQFNTVNASFHIEIIDYGDGVTVYNPDENPNYDFYAGLTKLNTELIAGNIPDILDLKMLPYYQYASIGLLEDLYPFIDSDPTINRDDLVESALSAAEIEGRLYQLFPTFSVRTIAGHPNVLGSNTSWSLADLMSVLSENPNADMPLGRGHTETKTGFLRDIISHSIEDYIDWGNASTNFDTEAFVEVLEFVNNTFPDEPVMGDDFNSPAHLFASHRQIMTVMNINNAWEYRFNKAMFGGDIVFKGIPGNNNSFNSITDISGLGITMAAKDKDGAWQFVRTLLDEDYQLSLYNSLPTNKNALDILLDRWIEDTKESVAIYDPVTEEFWFELQPITREDIEIIMILIESTSVTTGWSSLDNTFWNIIFESAEDFFDGQSTVQNAARVVQSRVSIYVSEHS